MGGHGFIFLQDGKMEGKRRKTKDLYFDLSNRKIRLRGIFQYTYKYVLEIPDSFSAFSLIILAPPAPERVRASSLR